MELICTDCAHVWESDRESLAEYTDSPRCSNCEARAVRVLASEGETGPRVDPVEAEAVSRFRDGETPLDLVESGLCSMARAEELRAEFNSISSEYSLISGDRIAEIRESAYQDGLAAGRKEAQERAATAFENGRSQAWARATQVVKTAKRL